MSATQTGIPIRDCLHCGYRHPISRRHCPACGLATLFGHEDCTPLYRSIFDALEAQP